MFYFIYKFNDEVELEEILSKMKNLATYSIFDELPFRLYPKEPTKINQKFQNYKFNGQDEIDGFIAFDNLNNDYSSEIPFKIRIKSKFIFIETDFEMKKAKTAKALNKTLNKELIRFIPFYEDELKFICNIAFKHELKFFFDGDIINDTKLEKKYCMNELNEDYSLFEAYLELKTDQGKIPVYYYGDAIQFPPRVNEEDVEYVIQAFENVMTEN